MTGVQTCALPISFIYIFLFIYLFVFLAALTLRLKEKEKFLIEAGELLVEAQKHYETQRNKAEQLMREKAAVIGEYQSIQDTLQAELDKAKFDLRELEVTTETLRIENKQMVQEISEISGDAAIDRSSVPRQNDQLNRNIINPDSFGTTYVTDHDSSFKDLSLTASSNGKNSMAYTSTFFFFIYLLFIFLLPLFSE